MYLSITQLIQTYNLVNDEIVSVNSIKRKTMILYDISKYKAKRSTSEWILWAAICIKFIWKVEDKLLVRQGVERQRLEGLVRRRRLAFGGGRRWNNPYFYPKRLHKAQLR